MTEANYGRILDQYMSDIKTNDQMEKEMKKMEIMEKTFRNSIFDFIFPWHMQLGRFEKDTVSAVVDGKTIEDDADNASYAYTPFKTFNRRRNYLVWMHSSKFNNVFTDEERETLKKIEHQQFLMSLGMKGLSLFTLMHLRFLWRPVGRPILFDISLVYLSLYAFLGSNIPGVFLTWNDYKPFT